MCVRHSPPAPLNVGRPDEADRPAPRRARTRLDFRKYSWKDLIPSPSEDVRDADCCDIADSFRRWGSTRDSVLSVFTDELCLVGKRQVGERGRNGCMEYFICQPRWHELWGCCGLETGGCHCMYVLYVCTRRVRITSPHLPPPVQDDSSLIRYDYLGLYVHVVASSVELPHCTDPDRAVGHSVGLRRRRPELIATDRVQVGFLDRNDD